MHASLQPLTEGQHRPKASKKKKTRQAGLFFSGSKKALTTSSVVLQAFKI
jgi:hypothetical protein